MYVFMVYMYNCICACVRVTYAMQLYTICSYTSSLHFIFDIHLYT